MRHERAGRDVPWLMSDHARLPLLLAMSLPLASCGPGPRPAPEPGAANVVRAEQGALRGERLDNGVVAFHGVPYARPPVGERRWRPPAPPMPWSGERDAAHFAPACPQDDGTAVYYRRAARRLGRGSTGIAPLGPTSEDCLYLNVWTPEPAPGTLLPVLVWIHGGAGTSGSGADRLFRGRHLAARGVVVVTINYRLGALGFLAHPALSREDPDGVSGNYGYQDILQALRWIRANAVAFGGDPERIAVAGQSAGASLAELLMVTPAATTLFHRVIAQSATLLRPLPLRTDDEGDSGEAEGIRFMARLGLGPDASAAELRAIPVDSLIAAMARAGDDTPARPVIDGRLIPDSPAHLWARGEFAHFPMLCGSNDDEMALLMPPMPIEPDAYRQWVREHYGERAGDILALRPSGHDAESTRRQQVRLLSDEYFRTPTLLLLRWTGGRIPVWLYRFAWKPDDGRVGAFHGIDIPFLFDTRAATGWWAESSTTDRITDAVQNAWIRFASGAEPGGGALPLWPRATPDAPVVMVIDSVPSVEPMPAAPMIRRLADDLAGSLQHER